MNNTSRKKKEAGHLQKKDAALWSRGERWIYFGLIILFVMVVRARLLDVPLERDEGEYAYMGQLLLQGVPPYSEAYNMKLPGTYLMYAGIMSLFGQSIRGIHLGFMLLNLATILLVFQLGRKIVNDFAAGIASAVYAVLSLSSNVFGFAAHATHFVALPAVGGALLLLLASGKNKQPWYFLSGTLFGLAFIMKQPGLFFILFGASYIIYHDWLSKPEPIARRLLLHLCLFLSGALLPFLTVALWLYASGVFAKFWFWTFQYAAQYGTQVPLSQAFAVFRRNFLEVADGFLLLWLASVLGPFAAFFHPDLKKTRVFILLFALFSFLTICPGFYFRPHYFVTLLPASSLLIGIFFHFVASRGALLIKPSLARIMALGIFTALLSVGIVSQKAYLFQEGPADVSRNAYGLNPFPESLEIARFIEARTGKDDRIAVLGSEPQIYFYSKRRSASGHIYMYGLMERHDHALAMQKDMIREIESSNPKFVVLVAAPTSWLVQQDSEKYVFGWIDDYIRRYYILVGVADTVPEGKTVYRWHDEAEKYVVQSPYHVLIFERRDDRIPPA